MSWCRNRLFAFAGSVTGCLLILSWVFFVPAAYCGNFNRKVLVSVPSFTGSAYAGNKVSPSEWPHKKSDLRPDPNLVQGKLKNGFRYVLLENYMPKDRVSMHLNIQAGSVYETDNQQGLAHFLEHMLFCGSTHFKPGELVKYFQSIGMKFGPDANAHTGFYETVYDILLPGGNKNSLADGLLVMRDYAQGALLLDSEVDRERKVILAEKRERDSASYRTFTSTLKFEFPDSIISRRLPIGMEEIINKTGRSLLKDFYDKWYRPDNMILVIVGDFDAKTAVALIEEKFSGLSARSPVPESPSLGEIRHKGIKAFYHFEKEAGNASVSVETISKVFHKPDSYDFQRKQLTGNMANEIVQNRLNSMSRKANCPFTSASIGSGIYMKQIEFSDISAKCSPENWDRTLGLLEQTLRKAFEYGFTNSELERVKKDYLADLENSVKKASTRDSSKLARQIIRTLNSDRVFQSPVQEKELFAPVVDSLTLKAVHEAFKSDWEADHRLVLLTGNSNLVSDNGRPEEKILSTYEKSRLVKVSSPVEKRTVRFPYFPEPDKKGKITGRKYFAELGVIQIDFENGVRLNLKKTDFKANQVLAALTFGHGRASEPENRPGLARLSTMVINESGFGSLDRSELDRALAGKETSVAFGISQESFLLKGRTISKELPLLFQLLYAYITDPGIRSDAFSLSMERFKHQYASLGHSIDGAMTLSGRRFLAGGDSRFGLPPYDRFRRLTRTHIQSWLESSFKNDKLEISLVGDFDNEAVIELASKYFGSFSERKRDELKDGPGYPKFPVAQTIKLKVDTKLPKGLVVVAYPTEDLWDIHRTRRLSVLAEIFSERLREKIREKLGVSYSPFAFNRPSRAFKGYGVFHAFVEVDPVKTDLVAGEIKEIVTGLIDNGITADELNRALEPMLTGIKESRRKNSYWLNTVLSLSFRHPQQLDWSRTIMKDYASITVDELSGLARKYLVNDRSAVIIIRPLQH